MSMHFHGTVHICFEVYSVYGNHSGNHTTFRFCLDLLNSMNSCLKAIERLTQMEIFCMGCQIIQSFVSCEQI